MNMLNQKNQKSVENQSAINKAQMKQEAQAQEMEQQEQEYISKLDLMREMGF